MIDIVNKVLEHISAYQKKQTKERIVIAIDGMCGAGKSTLAGLLHESLGGNLFHMDDFFLQPHQRTAERLKEIGGNVDYERFREEVTDHLVDVQGFVYGVYDCGKQCIYRQIQVKSANINIIEGSYSLHPYFEDKADIKVFLSVDSEEQIKRISNRNTKEQVNRFIKEWIPKEKLYFEEYDIPQKCICFDTTHCKMVSEKAAGSGPVIGLIVAYSKNRVIGKDGRIPWRIEGEQKRFRELTTGNVVIMGRKTYEEIGKPLPNRYTIVVSNTKKFEAENCTTVGTLKEALEIADKSKNVYISGGAELYKEAIDIVDKMFITEIDAEIEGDTFFSEFEEKDFHREVESHVDGEIPYTYVTYTRKHG
ncbi:MAG: dihydrofolate reductase [Lachnospiraceae bacterium]|nr:dihydrofolate reductase [Lachnospiraceae bacterium]